MPVGKRFKFHSVLALSMSVLLRVCILEACDDFIRFTTSVQLETNMKWLDFEIKGQRSQQEHMWSNKVIGRQFLTCLHNARTYLNETYIWQVLITRSTWRWYFQGHGRGSEVEVTEKRFRFYLNYYWALPLRRIPVFSCGFTTNIWNSYACNVVTEMSAPAY